MRSRVFILLGLVLHGHDGVSATETGELACSGGIRDDVVIEATGEAVSVSTIIRPVMTDAADPEDRYDWPIYEQTVRHAGNAKAILSLDAQRLFDTAGPLTCEARLSAAQRQLVEIVQSAKPLDLSDTRIMSQSVRMSQLAACLVNPDACNAEPHYVRPSDALEALGHDAFGDLLSSEPLVFTVFRSACSSNTYLYKPGQSTALLAEQSDC